MTHRIAIVLTICLISLPPTLLGQSVRGIVTQGYDVEKPESPIKVIIYPVAECRPALKYQLMPPLLERRPGNAAVWWNRLPAERIRFMAEYFKEGGEYEKIERWLEIPLGDPREKLLRPKSINAGNLFSDIDRAARFEACDWELPFREGNVINILLPEAQQTRAWGRLLSAKARLEIAQGNYDQAVHTLQAGFALARHVNQGPTMIHGLVAGSIASTMIDRASEITQQADGPNLYWAYSALPSPLIDFRLAFEAENNLLQLQFPELHDAEQKHLSAEAWRDLLFKIVEFVQINSSGEHLIVTVPTVALQGYPQARNNLIRLGRSEAEVDAMPVAKVIVLYSLHKYEELANDTGKWTFLPYAEAIRSLEREEKRLRSDISSNDEIIPIARTLLASFGRCKTAETRTTWYIARLRALEALRIYAADNGRLPDNLNDVVRVPVPMNPFDGKPFKYERHGDTASLDCEAGPPGGHWRMEITLGRKQR